jgi:hypothetical protein
MSMHNARVPLAVALALGGVIAYVNAQCYSTVDTGSNPCLANTVPMGIHPPCPSCTDFIIWTDPINCIATTSTGFTAHTSVTASCLVQAKRCVVSTNGVMECRAAGVYTFTSTSEDVAGDPCDDGVS